MESQYTEALIIQSCAGSVCKSRDARKQLVRRGCDVLPGPGRSAEPRLTAAQT